MTTTSSQTIDSLVHASPTLAPTYTPPLSQTIKLPSWPYWVGWMLVIAFMIQMIVVLQWDALAQWQSDSLYRQISGFALFCVILWQWRLYLARKANDKNAILLRRARHPHYGSLALIALYAHSMTLGFGYQILLSGALIAVIVTGLLSPEGTNYRPKWYIQSWLVVHVALAVIVPTLALYHIYIVYTFH